MSKVTIVTDNKWKFLKYRDEVPASVLVREFDYQDDEVTDGYFRYRGWWYHIDQFMYLPPESPLHGWDGYAGDSLFSGILVKVSRDGERYKVGRYWEA